jgi:DEAD/DEAH box helicase domain-containing protein
MLPMSTRENLDTLLESPEFAPNILVNQLLPAEPGSFSPFPASLDERIATALRRRDIERLYTHQAEVWDLAEKEHDCFP